MPTTTYEQIASTVLGSAQSDYTFTSIPQTYKHLVLTCDFPSSGFNWSTQVGNNTTDTGLGYSVTRLYGTGSGNAASNTYGADYYFTGNVTAGANSSAKVTFFDYANTSRYKNCLMRFDDASAITFVIGGYWNNTVAINRVRVWATAGNLASGTVLSLYGIAG